MRSPPVLSRFALALACLLPPVPSEAQERKVASITLSGVGSFGCGRYLADRRAENETMTMLYQQWAAGYSAGYSHASTRVGSTTDLAQELDTYTAWLDKWCADDPTSSITSGLNALLIKLARRQ